VWLKILATGDERDLDFPQSDDLLRGGHAVRIKGPSEKTIMDVLAALTARVEALEKQNDLSR
jgi:hypothetical protein